MIVTDVDRAADALKIGQVIAFPTETVYGLAAPALDEHRVEHIFEIKGRPTTNPVIVHVADVEMARGLAQWTDDADRVAAACWPGPVTLVLERLPVVPDIVTAGGRTVGIRCPDHDLARAFIRRVGVPVVGPSANRAGHVSPTTAAHVQAEFGDDVLVLDGGPCRAGIESTVLSLAARPFRVLRPGLVAASELARHLGEPVEAAAGAIPGIAASPGLLPKHYAPSTPCRLVDRVTTSDTGRICALVQGTAPAGLHATIDMPADARQYARALYDALRRADGSGADLILIERPPVTGRDERETAVWQAVADRLQRATAP